MREETKRAVPPPPWLVAVLGRREGQGMVEYALVLVLVAIIVIAVLATMGQQLSNAFREVVSEISRTRS